VAFAGDVRPEKTERIGMLGPGQQRHIFREFIQPALLTEIFVRGWLCGAQSSSASVTLETGPVHPRRTAHSDGATSGAVRKSPFKGHVRLVVKYNPVSPRPS